jgi:hypothetical protein
MLMRINTGRRRPCPDFYSQPPHPVVVRVKQPIRMMIDVYRPRQVLRPPKMPSTPYELEHKLGRGCPW